GSLLVDGGDWLGDLFEGFAGGLDAEEGFDQAADDHDGGADQVAPEQGGAGGAGADQRAVEEGAERAGDRADGEEDRDRLGADLDRPGFTDGEVGGAGAGGGEEEDDDPHDGLRGRVEDLGVEQDRRKGQQNARDDVGAGDHLLAAPGVKQRPQDQRPAQVADGKRQPIQRDLVRGHVVEVDQHQRVGEEDRVIQERLGDHQCRAQDGPPGELVERQPQERQVPIPGLRDDLDRLALVDRLEFLPGRLDL